uniref:Uncharacterized protein n=1 Tax=viral metagenome TaxID=1070528 RepID=A0A6C0J650_9ZZZZ
MNDLLKNPLMICCIAGLIAAIVSFIEHKLESGENFVPDYTRYFKILLLVVTLSYGVISLSNSNQFGNSIQGGGNSGIQGSGSGIQGSGSGIQGSGSGIQGSGSGIQGGGIQGGSIQGGSSNQGGNSGSSWFSTPKTETVIEKIHTGNPDF